MNVTPHTHDMHTEANIYNALGIILDSSSLALDSVFSHCLPH